MKNGHFLQQGDVLMKQVDLPAEALKEGTKVDRNILAEGEATGHYHQAVGEGVKVVEFEGATFLHAPNGAEVTHQEHHTTTLPPGDYKIDGVQEFNHFEKEAQRVVD